MKRSEKITAETDLYRPVHDYLVEQGYTVRSEVHHCDIAAVRGEDLVVIEMKRSLTLGLLTQAVERQKITDSVYVAVPRPSNMRTWNARTRSLQRLLKRLELGLILVSIGPARPGAEVVFHPIESARRKQKRARRAVISEIGNRIGDFNQGGSTRRKLVTAYRENAVQIACCLVEHGAMSPKDLRALGTGDKTLAILRNNVYSWFERVSHGVYAVTSRGRAEIGQVPRTGGALLTAAAHLAAIG